MNERYGPLYMRDVSEQDTQPFYLDISLRKTQPLIPDVSEQDTRPMLADISQWATQPLPVVRPQRMSVWQRLTRLIHWLFR